MAKKMEAAAAAVMRGVDVEATASTASDPAADEGSGDGGGGGEYVTVRTRSGVCERLVTPYNFDFRAGCKARWEGRTLLNVFMNEFPIRTEGYYRKAIAAGRLRVERRVRKNKQRENDEENGAQKSTDDDHDVDGGVLRNGDVIIHRIHRHEPPVLYSGPIDVLGTSENYVAVCKPASMPVHVCGQYRLNSMLSTLARERADLGPLFSCNRLDVPVSGVIVLARSSGAARDFSNRLEDRRVRKLYVARVSGDFSDVFRDTGRSEPRDGCGGNNDDVYECEVPLGYDPSTRRAFVTEGIDPEDPCKKRKSRGQPSPPTRDAQGRRLGSYAKTRFKLLCRSEDGLSSVVLCEPVTGRTHQIRAHLMHAGHPIVDDEAYNDNYMGPSSGTTTMGEACTAGKGEEEEAEEKAAESSRCVVIVGDAPRPWTVEATCPHCPFLRSPDFDAKPPQSLCLHAMYYAAEELFEYMSKSLPEWAERRRWLPVDMFGISMGCK